MDRNLGRLPVLAVVAVLLAAGCSAPRTGLILRGGPFFVGGSVGASSGPVSGDSTAEDLGLEAAFALQPRVDVDWDDWHLSANLFGVESTGSGNAEARLSWNGQVIERGVATDSTLGVGMITADFAWDPVPWEFMDIGVGAGLGYLWFEVEVLAAGTATGLRYDQSTPLGYLLLRLAKQTPDGGVVLRIAGISASLEDDEISYYEFDLMGNVRLFGGPEAVQGDLILGYRYLHAEYVYSGNYTFETDPTLQGPYIGFALVF